MANERFVSKDENDEIVKNTFIMFGYAIVSIIVVVALIWSYSYNNNLYLFIIIYSLIIILYTAAIISLVVINKDTYDNITYKLLPKFNSLNLFDVENIKDLHYVDEVVDQNYKRYSISGWIYETNLKTKNTISLL